MAALHCDVPIVVCSKSSSTNYLFDSFYDRTCRLPQALPVDMVAKSGSQDRKQIIDGKHIFDQTVCPTYRLQININNPHEMRGLSMYQLSKIHVIGDHHQKADGNHDLSDQHTA